MSKKNILFYAGNVNWLINPRGGEKSMKFIAEYLSNQFNIYIFLLDESCNNNKLKKINNVTYIIFPFKITINLYRKMDIKIIALINNVIDKYNIDFIFSHSYFGETAARCCKIKNIKYIHFVRWWAEFREKRPISRLLENKNENLGTIQRFKEIFEVSYGIVTNNNWAKDIIKYYYGQYIRHDNILVSYVPILIENFKTSNKKYLTLITPDKNLGEYELLKFLVEKLPHENFLFVNVKKSSPFQKFKSNKNVTIIDYVSDMDNIVYQNTKILLYVAYNDDVCGTSRVAIEVMKYKIPSISNKSCGLDEIIPFTVSQNAKYKEWIEQINFINENYEFCEKICEKIYLDYHKKINFEGIINLLK